MYGMCANPPSARSKSVTAYDLSQCKQDTTNTGIVSIHVFKLNFKSLHFLFDAIIYRVTKRGHKKCSLTVLISISICNHKFVLFNA